VQRLRTGLHQFDLTNKSELGPSAGLYPIHGIIKESTRHFLAVWKGVDENDNDRPWNDWWVAKREVNVAAKNEWKVLRAEDARRRKKQRVDYENGEKTQFEKAKAEKAKAEKAKAEKAKAERAKAKAMAQKCASFKGKDDDQGQERSEEDDEEDDDDDDPDA
jgi:hypothetical protein